jgi:hypothetical protein
VSFQVEEKLWEQGYREWDMRGYRTQRLVNVVLQYFELRDILRFEQSISQ